MSALAPPVRRVSGLCLIPLLLMAAPTAATELQPVSPVVRFAHPAVDPDGDRISARLDVALQSSPAQRQLALLLALDHAPTSEDLKWVRAMGGRVRAVFSRLVYLIIADLPAASVPGLLSALSPSLILADLDMQGRANLLNGTRRVRARQVWQGGVAGLPALTGAGTRLAVVDTGLDDSHPDLVGKLRQEHWRDFVGAAGNGEPLYEEATDRYGHGTSVGSAASGSGAASDGDGYALTLSRRFPDEEGSGYTQAFTLALGETARPIRLQASWEAGAVALSLKRPYQVPPDDPPPPAEEPPCRRRGVTLGSLATEGPELVFVSDDYANVDSRAWWVHLYTRRQDEIETSGSSYAAQLTVPHDPVDDRPLMSGVAPDADLMACKALDDAAHAPSVAGLLACLEWLAETGPEAGLVAVNLSMNFEGVSVAVDDAVNNLVRLHDIAVVASAGNDQREGGRVRTPGSSELAITVGAVNTEGRLTMYSSLGEPGSYKPDLVAPGGSFIEGSPFFAADSNDAACKPLDLFCGRDADPYRDDYLPFKGTSQAAPLVTGALALLAEARGGASLDVLEAKALLLMTAVETGGGHERKISEDCSEERGEDPLVAGFPVLAWDEKEGFGELSVEAFLEAALVEQSSFPVQARLSSAWGGRRVWARRISAPAGTVHRFVLLDPPEADFQMALYDSRPDELGRPVLLEPRLDVAEANRGGHVAVLVGGDTGSEAILVVKRRSGEGEFFVRRSETGSQRCAVPGEESADDAPVAGEQCEVGRGSCRNAGRYSCFRGGWAVCETQAGEPADELCDTGLDEDCDGSVDEGFPALGSDCQAGEGLCRVRGQVVCTEDGLGEQCDAVAAEPVSPEICGNGQDDDCNGEVDDGFQLDEPCTVGEGACAVEGVMVCGPEGSPSLCNASPGAGVDEICGNEIDDDCDGTTDEGLDLGAPCFSGQGACAASGVMVCSAQGTVVCGAQPAAPQQEICETGGDEDCDGLVDEACNAPRRRSSGAEGCGCKLGAGSRGESLSPLLRAVLRR